MLKSIVILPQGIIFYVVYADIILKTRMALVHCITRYFVCYGMVKKDGVFYRTTLQGKSFRQFVVGAFIYLGSDMFPLVDKGFGARL